MLSQLQGNLEGPKAIACLHGDDGGMIQVAMGRRPQLSVFGSDWDTEDGTGDVFYIFNCFGICVQFFFLQKRSLIFVFGTGFFMSCYCAFL